jgi:hypothetical protein
MPATRVLVESARQLVGLDAAVKVREALVVLLRPAVDLILERLHHLLEAFQPDPGRRALKTWTSARRGGSLDSAGPRGDPAKSPGERDGILLLARLPRRWVAFRKGDVRSREGTELTA